MKPRDRKKVLSGFEEFESNRSRRWRRCLTVSFPRRWRNDRRNGAPVTHRQRRNGNGNNRHVTGHRFRKPKNRAQRKNKFRQSFVWNVFLCRIRSSRCSRCPIPDKCRWIIFLLLVFHFGWIFTEHKKKRKNKKRTRIFKNKQKSSFSFSNGPVVRRILIWDTKHPETFLRAPKSSAIEVLIDSLRQRYEPTTREFPHKTKKSRYAKKMNFKTFNFLPSLMVSFIAVKMSTKLECFITKIPNRRKNLLWSKTHWLTDFTKPNKSQIVVTKIYPLGCRRWWWSSG